MSAREVWVIVGTVLVQDCCSVCEVRDSLVPNTKPWMLVEMVLAYRHQ